MIGLVLLGPGALGCDSGETTTGGTAGTGGMPGTGGAGGSSGAGGAGGGLSCPEDPAEGSVAEGCGIWVSIGKGDDANEGTTQAAPVATLTHAIALAAKGSGRVYACSEMWAETLIVPDSVSLHGGFDCQAGWAYVGKAKRSTVMSPGPIGITWISSGEPTAAVMSDFSIRSADAVEPGGSSIAGFVRDDMTLTVYRSELIAGNGADGADGLPGDASDLPAASGAPGNNGADACSAAVSPGGTAVENVCSSGTSKGGAGGDSSAMIASNGADGEPAGGPPGGDGGLGQELSPVCTVGGPGVDGEDGAHGQGGGKDSKVGYGRLTETGYVGIPGEHASQSDRQRVRVS